MKPITDNDGPPFLNNDVATVTIAFTNDGCEDATGVVVTDPVDLARFAGNSIKVTSGNGTFNGTNVVWNVGPLAMGATATMAYTATIKCKIGDQVCNEAAITCDQYATCAPPCTVPTNRPCRVCSNVVLELSQTFVDSNGLPLLPGDTVTSTIVVDNTGASGATNVVVIASPDAVNLENIQAQDGGLPTGSTISWIVGTLNQGASATVHYTGVVRCKLASGLPIADRTQICSNNYMVTSTETGDIQGNPIPCLTVSRPVLTINKEILTQPVDKIHAGDTVDYRITVCNTGSTRGTNLRVYDTMNTTYLVTPPTTIGQGGTWNAGAGRIEWTIAQLSPQPPCQELTCSVQVSSTAPDYQSICDSGTIEAEDLYTSCAWPQPGQPIAEYPACFEVAPPDIPPNHLLKNCCSSAENPCNRGSKFPLTRERLIAQPPSTEIELGLTDTAQPLCFYQTERPTPGNSLTIIKNNATPANPDDMAISY
jgi:uncharacterized repeat protein (TIGR01451 family)